MLIMPYSHDQPDNARRMRRLKVSRTIQKKNYQPARVAKKLAAMLEDPEFAQRAKAVAKQICREDGVKTACDALEALHRRAAPVSNRSSTALR
jgi:UDP:flavonoid glycosyltransferase YjiC (YdhE family)